METDELIKLLQSRNENIERALAESRVVDDVLDRKILSRRAGTQNEKYTAYDVYAGVAGGECLHYLPKGRMEPQLEYAQRVAGTPFFPECPGIMNDRQGALFSSPPELEGDDSKKYNDFRKNCNGAGMPMLDAIAQTARLIPRNGLCAVFVDRKPMDEETAALKEAGQLSEQVAQEKGLKMPRLAIYSAHDILNLRFDSIGLSWVKLRECSTRQETWDAPAVDVETIRVIDRNTIRSWEIIKEPNKKATCTELASVTHGMVDKNGKPRCPVAIGTSPIELVKGVGLTMMAESAQADVCATRLLSDILWCLFVLGQPILTYTTHTTDEDELKKFGLGASKYVPLKTGTSGKSDEKLAYCVLDSNGIDLQIEMHAQMKQTARTSAGKGADQAEIAPTAESGVSRAWKFKTGEERTLFLITNQLKALWEQVLDMCAVVMGLDAEKVSIRFSTKFDVGADSKSTEVINGVLATAQSHKLPALARAAMHRLVNTLGTLSEDEENEIRAEIDAMELQAEVQADDTGKIPLVVQQLALAAERADKQGKKKLADKLRMKIDELVARLGAGAEGDAGKAAA